MTQGSDQTVIAVYRKPGNTVNGSGLYNIINSSRSSIKEKTLTKIDVSLVGKASAQAQKTKNKIKGNRESMEIF
jgi:hypothetical protein